MGECKLLSVRIVTACAAPLGKCGAANVSASPLCLCNKTQLIWLSVSWHREERSDDYEAYQDMTIDLFHAIPALRVHRNSINALQRRQRSFFHCRGEWTNVMTERIRILDSSFAVHASRRSGTDDQMGCINSHHISRILNTRCCAESRAALKEGIMLCKKRFQNISLSSHCRL